MIPTENDIESMTDDLKNAMCDLLSNVFNKYDVSRVDEHLHDLKMMLCAIINGEHDD